MFVTLYRTLIVSSLALIFIGLGVSIDPDPADRAIKVMSQQSFSCPSSGDDPDDARENTIGKLLPSLGEENTYEIFPASSFEIAGEGDQISIRFDPESPAEPDIIEINLERDVAVNENRDVFTYSGTVEGFSNSLAVFYLRTDAPHPFELSGYFVLDLTEESADATAPFENWYFIESIRPVLSRALLFRPAGNEQCAANLDRFFPVDDAFHVVYEVRETSFSIDLNPFEVDETSQGNLASTNVFKQNSEFIETDRTLAQPCVADACLVDLEIMVDDAFASVFVGAASVPSVTDDVERMYRLITVGTRTINPGVGTPASQIEPNFLGDDVEVFLTLQLQPGTGDARQVSPNTMNDPPNAYDLLCAISENPMGMEHHDVSPGSGPARIIHLMTGFDLGPIPAPPAGSTTDLSISDYGDGLCPMGCGDVDGKIVGLAESIGGFSRTGHLSSGTPGGACGVDPTTAHQDVIGFDSGHHSLSQHVGTSSDTLPSAVVNFDGILVQRWVLLAHEIAHNLGARHSTSDASSIVKSVMHPDLSQNIGFYFANESIDEMNDCIDLKLDLASSVMDC